jgi:hypothetical protein
MPKSPRISVLISPEDDAWLAGQAEEIGCDKATVVRMMIRRAVKSQRLWDGAVAPNPLALASPQPREAEGVDEATLEAILASRVAEAEEKGLTAAPELGTEEPVSNGVSFSLKSAPPRRAIDYR